MQDAASRLRAGEAPQKVLQAGRRRLARQGFKVDYLEARKATGLDKLEAGNDAPVRLLAAVYLGSTRLIDNIEV